MEKALAEHKTKKKAWAVERLYLEEERKKEERIRIEKEI